MTIKSILDANTSHPRFIWRLADNVWLFANFFLPIKETSLLDSWLEFSWETDVCMYIFPQRLASSYSLRRALPGSTMTDNSTSHTVVSLTGLLWSLLGEEGRDPIPALDATTHAQLLCQNSLGLAPGKRPVQLPWPKLSSILNTTWNCRWLIAIYCPVSIIHMAILLNIFWPKVPEFHFHVFF